MSEQLDAQGVENASTETNAVEDPTVEGAEALGDAGKKALDSMKAKWKEEAAQRKEEAASRKALEAELAALKAAAEGREAEHKAALETQKIHDEALASANERIKKAEVRALAKGELANAEDALLFLDLDQIEVSEDGSVDSEAVQAAIKELLTTRPYLAASGTQSVRPPVGDIGQGPRNVGDGGALPQLERELAAATTRRDIAASVAIRQQIAAIKAAK